jgi:hypothetical protein
MILVLDVENVTQAEDNEIDDGQCTIRTGTLNELKCKMYNKQMVQ